MNDVIQLTASIKEIVNDGLKSLPKGAEIIADAAKFIGDSVQQAMEFEKIAKSIETLAGSRNGGAELMSNLKEFEKATILGSGVYKDAQAMLSHGIGSTEIIKDLKQIGDVAMGDEEHVAALSLAFAKTHEAGKLLGENLKEYTNAGFNPLKVISEHWQEFGLKQKASISQLKEMMEAGKISADMVSKSFEVATSKGGQFNGMMDAIGETTLGQMQKLKGNWAALQIDLGNKLMPIASDFLSAALSLLNINETIPDKLLEERVEINSLITSITSLNEHNEMRGRLVDILKAKYPDIFANISKEKTKNSELLGVLKDVNAEYDRRIKLEQHKIEATSTKQEADYLVNLAARMRAEADYDKRGPMHKYIGIWEQMKLEWSKYHFEMRSPSELRKSSDEAMKIAQNLYKDAARANDLLKVQEQINMRADVNSLMNDPAKQNALWGADANKNIKDLQTEILLWNRLYKENGSTVKGSLLTHDWGRLLALITGNPAKDAKTPGGGSGTASGKGSAINSGGVRAVTINLGKFFDNFTINTQTINEGIDHLDNAVAESLLRVMNSAAKARE